ncbi:transporter [Flavitalea sp.]|nr:transporter [Flavitalea sp.]
MSKHFIVSIFLLAAFATAQSQEKEMNPDRPDQTEEVHLVPKRKFMLETGVSTNRFDSGRNANIVKAMLRYGLTKGVELGFLMEQGRDRNRYIEETVQSTYPLALRLKLALLEKHQWLPDITLVTYWQVPVSKNDQGEHAQNSISMLLAFLDEFSDKWKLEYNAGFQQEAFSKDIAWQVYTSIHYKFAEKVESFVGSYSQFQKHKQPFHNVDAGLGFKLKENLQLDVAVGTSVDYPERNRFLTVGFSVLL